MSENNLEQFGQPGLENRAYGSQPVHVDSAPEPVLTPSEAADAIGQPRQAEPEPISRDYIRHEDGRPKRFRNEDGTFAADATGNELFEREPSRNWVTAEEAGRDLAATRHAEDAALREAEQKAIQDAVDQIRSGQPQQQPQQPVQQPQYQQQPPTNADAINQLGEAINQLDGLIASESNINLVAGWQEKRAELATQLEQARYRAAFEQFPELTHSIEAEINQRTQAYQQQVAQAYQQSQYATQTAIASLTTNFPELAGVNTMQDLQTALTVMERSNPERWQAAAATLRNVVSAAQHAQQIGQQHAANQRQQFENYRKAEIERFEERNAEFRDAEHTAKVSRQVADYLKGKGLSDAEHDAVYHSPIAQHHVFQEALVDAARYRAASSGAREKIARPVARVQRPGSPAERVPDSDHTLTALDKRLSQSGNPRDAAELLMALRARR